MNKIIILSAGPGLPEVVTKYGHSSEWIPDILSNHQVEFEVKKVYENDFDSITDVDGWIITGSKYSVYDNIDWIKNLQKHIEKIISKNKPILGICFGHQLLAKTLGGVVEKNSLGWELGSYRINLTDSGKESMIFSGINDKDLFYESHQDVVTKLPANSISLAYNNKGNQSFKYGNSVYGVQFHPEFSYDIIKELMRIRINKGIRLDNNNLELSINGKKILHNFIDILEKESE